MTDLSNFGSLVRNRRKEKGLTLNLVSNYLKIDTSTLCKIEKNERTATRDLVLKLAKILEIDAESLLISYYSDKVAYEIWKEKDVANLLKVAEQKVAYLKNSNIKQSNINF